MGSCPNPHPHRAHTILRLGGGPGDAVVCDGRPQQPPTALTLTLGRLGAGRDLADDLVDNLGDLRGRHVTIDATAVQSVTGSFVAQLVARILAPGGADRLSIRGGPAHVGEYAGSTAARLGVTARLGIDTGGGAD